MAARSTPPGANDPTLMGEDRSMAGTPAIPHIAVAKPGWDLAPRPMSSLSASEAFRVVRHLWRDPLQSPCTFACGTCLLCRIHERIMKRARLKKLQKGAGHV